MIIDQATKLREMARGQKAEGRRQKAGPAAGGPLPTAYCLLPADLPPRLKTIAVTSGKGGVGKTSVVTNLGILCAMWGYRVAIFDADLSLANVDVLLGIRPRYNLSHVISGEKKLQDILHEGPNGIILIPASCGVESLANLTSTQMEMLLNDLEQFSRSLHLLFIDTGAGVSDNVLPFILAAGEVIIVTTPEPTAITDAYAVIKIITQRRRKINENAQPLKLLVNMVESSMEAEEVMERILLVIKRFLNTTVEFGGYILKDERVSKAIMAQSPLILSYPHSEASKCIFKIAKQITDFRPMVHGDNPLAPSSFGKGEAVQSEQNKTKNFFSEVIKLFF